MLGRIEIIQSILNYLIFHAACIILHENLSKITIEKINLYLQIQNGS